MSKFPYMKWFPKDYLADTMHLTPEQDGVYRRLLDMAWMSGDGTLPNEDAELARFARISIRVWRRLKPDLVPFFDEVDGRLIHQRIAKDRQSLAETSAKQSANSKARWLKTNETGDAVGMPNHSHSQIKKEEGSHLAPDGAPPPEAPKKVNGHSVELTKAFNNYNVCAEQCGLPTARMLTKDRARKLRQRLDEHGMDGWVDALEAIEQSNFLQGKNDRHWKASLDFLLQPSSLNKVLEGVYSNDRS